MYSPYAASGVTPASIASSFMMAFVGASRTPLLNRSINLAVNSQYTAAVAPEAGERGAGQLAIHQVSQSRVSEGGMWMVQAVWQTPCTAQAMHFGQDRTLSLDAQAMI